MTSEEMLKYKIKSGYWMVNIAPLGEKPDWIEIPKIEFNNSLIFGRTINEIERLQGGKMK